VRAAFTAVSLACVLAACGTERVKPADPLAVREPGQWLRATEARTGLSIEVPRTWQRDYRESPGLFRLVSGAAQVSAWAYKRTEPLPADDASLAAARDALVAEAKRRNPTLTVDAVRTREVGGAPGIEIVGSQEIEGTLVRTRSVHFFRDGAEFVIEALAPRRAFAKADRIVLERILDSLRFEEPGG